MLCFLLPAAGVQGGCTQWGRGEEAQGENPGSGQGAGPASACLGPSLRGGACRGREDGCTASSAPHYGLGRALQAGGGGQCHLPSGPADLKGPSVSPSLLCWNARKGVCRPGFCVTKAFQRVRSMAFSVAEAWQGECGPWPVPASRLLLRPAAWLWAWTD